jgi:hypothetical protein
MINPFLFTSPVTCAFLFKRKACMHSDGFIAWNPVGNFEAAVFTGALLTDFWSWIRRGAASFGIEAWA